MPDYTGMTVAEILKQKRAAIKQAALEPGSPSWDEILEVPWEEVIARANRGEPGYRTIKNSSRAGGSLSDKRRLWETHGFPESA